MSKSFCRGKYLKKNITILNQCVCCDYYHSGIGRVMAYKAYKPKIGVKNSISEYIDDEFLRLLNPNKKYIIYVSKAGIPGKFDVYTYEDAKKKGMIKKRG